uniref:MARVEL domain-containing protein n=1 Tax=Taeniopygia guttata TaxID=59729 RepID=A0A674H0X8_TAEGU
QLETLRQPRQRLRATPAHLLRAARGDYGYDFRARSPPPGSYYVEDAPQHFYRWWSPPGLVRVLEAAVLLLCVAVFACVAPRCGPGGYYGSGYYGSGVNYGYGYGGYYGGVTNPRAANGFMIAMAVLCFLAHPAVRGRAAFYLVVIVVCAVLALLMLVASIVYVVGVNPQAQMSGGYYYSPLLAMCNQVYAGGAVLNQYLYHYCTVDPQEVSGAPGTVATGHRDHRAPRPPGTGVTGHRGHRAPRPPGTGTTGHRGHRRGDGDYREGMGPLEGRGLLRGNRGQPRHGDYCGGQGMGTTGGENFGVWGRFGVWNLGRTGKFGIQESAPPLTHHPLPPPPPALPRPSPKLQRSQSFPGSRPWSRFWSRSRS